MTAHVFLTDFGLAKNTVTGSRYTRTGETLGTPQYMSPEQARGELAELTPASDVWALNCVLYELLSGGGRAFDGATPAAVIGAVLTHTPPRPPGIPPAVAQVLAAGLQRPVADRHADAGALRDDLQRAGEGQVPRVRARRRWGWARGATAVAVALAAGGVVWWRTPKRPPATATATVLTELEQQATGAWEARRDDLRAAARRIAAARAAGLQGSAWALRLGLLYWQLGENARALPLWESIPAGDGLRRRARLYCALQEMFSLDPVGQRVRSQEALPRLHAVAGDDRVGHIARAAIALTDGKPERALELLEHVEGWEAAMLRAYAYAPMYLDDGAAAAEQFRSAHRQGLSFAWSHLLLGTALSRTGAYAEAEAELTRSLRLLPGWQLTLHNRAMVRYRLHRYDAALQDIEAALAANPRYGRAYLLRANIHRLMGVAEGQLEDLSKAIEFAPDLVEARVNRANVYRRAGRFSEAAADLDAALAQRPGMAMALNARGLLHLAQGDPRAAVTDLEGALRAEPGLTAAHYNLGSALQALHRWTDAAAQFTAVLEAAPEHQQAWHRRAIVRGEEGRLPEALTDIDHAVALDPRSASARWWQGYLRWKGGRLKAAEAAFDACLALDPKRANALHYRAEVRLALGRPREALADCDASLPLQQPNAWFWRLRGRVHVALGHAAQAMADFNRAVQANPKYAHAFLDRARLHWSQGDRDAAIADFRTASSLKRKWAQPTLELGLALAAMRRYAEAEPLLRLVVRNCRDPKPRARAQAALDRIAKAPAGH